MKNIFLLLFACIFAHVFFFPSYCHTQDRPRTSISVIREIGDDNSYQEFLQMLERQIRDIKGIYSVGNSYGYLKDLQIKKATSPSDYESFWRDTNQLALLNSSIVTNERNIEVRSEVYLYELKGPISKNHIVIKQSYSPTAYEATRDSHRVVTYYALAMDAKRLKKAPSVIDNFLEQALKSSLNIPSSMQTDDIKQIIMAIKTERKLLKSGGLQPNDH
jgi:hypothetical protein